MADGVACEICRVSPPKTYIVKGKYTCHPCKHYFINPNKDKPIQVQVKDVRGGGEHASAHTTSMGTQAERSFVQFCVNNNLRLRPATKYENTVLHYDYVVEHRNPHINKPMYSRVEVKAVKSRRRGLPPDPRVIFVELKDIHGNQGWLYGRADLIAFHQSDGFMLIPRKELIKVVDEIRPTCRMAFQSGLHHTLYSRPDRQDLLIVLDISDIEHLSISLI